MTSSFLTRENFKDKWDNSKQWMEPLFSPLAEFERIARNRPHPQINKAYPKNTDGTLAAIIQEFGKRIVQQEPSGQVKTNKSDVDDIIANFVLTDEIIPHANSQADVLQKSWGVIGKGLTFGSQYTMTFFNNKGDYFGADFKLFYIKDGYQEPGKVTFFENNYYFIRAWYQESDIDAIIEREKELKRLAKENGEKYEPEWDIEALKRCKQWKAEKESGQLTAAEKERNMRSEAIEIIHGFQNGVGAKFYSYACGPGEFVKEKTNEDPRGIMPIQALYCDIDFENPLGKGLVDRSGGTQNVIDSMLQSYQYNRALAHAAPIIKRGDYNKTTLKLAPNAVWDLGTNPANSAELAKLDTTALNNFSQDYGLFKSQIIAMNNNGDTSVSSEVGNPGFSKTQAGVEAQQLKLGISDNYMKKQFNSWFKDVCESMLNIHFANKHGVEPLVLNNETANKIRKIDPELVDENNVYIIDYDAFTEAITFDVDAESTDKLSKQAQLDALDSFLERAQNSPIIQGLLQQFPEKAVEIYNQYVALTGVEDPEKLQIDEEQFKEMQAQQQAMQEQEMAQQAQVAQQPIEGEVMGQPGMEHPIGIANEDIETGEYGEVSMGNPDDELMALIDQDGDGEPDLDADEVQTIIRLQESGYADEDIAEVVTLMRDGATDDEIAEVLALAEPVEQEVMA